MGSEGAAQGDLTVLMEMHRKGQSPLCKCKTHFSTDFIY